LSYHIPRRKTRKKTKYTVRVYGSVADQDEFYPDTTF
jgi:hypothetical protein